MRMTATQGAVAQEVEAEDAEGGEVARGVAEAGAAGVLAEDDVEAPVALVLDAPVPADGVGDGGGVGGEAAEEEGALGVFMAVGETPGAVDAHQRPEARPLVFLEEEGEVSGVTQQRRVSRRPWPFSTCSRSGGREAATSRMIASTTPRCVGWFALSGRT